MSEPIRAGDLVEIPGITDSAWVKCVAGKYAAVMYEKWSDDFVSWLMVSEAALVSRLVFKKHGRFTATWWEPVE